MSMVMRSDTFTCTAMHDLMLPVCLTVARRMRGFPRKNTRFHWIRNLVGYVVRRQDNPPYQQDRPKPSPILSPLFPDLTARLLLSLLRTQTTPASFCAGTGYTPFIFCAEIFSGACDQWHRPRQDPIQ